MWHYDGHLEAPKFPPQSINSHHLVNNVLGPISLDIWKLDLVMNFLEALV